MIQSLIEDMQDQGKEPLIDSEDKVLIANQTQKKRPETQTLFIDYPLPFKSDVDRQRHTLPS